MLVKHRIYISLILLSLLPLVLISLLTERLAEDSLEKLIVQDFQSLAHEKADGIVRVIDERIHEVRLIASQPEILAAVKQANRLNQQRNSEEVLHEVHQWDQAWIANKGDTALAKRILQNGLSKRLSELQASRSDVYGEMFVTDRLGGTVAMTKVLSDYYQADEYWWQSAQSYLEEGAFLDDRGYDESVGSVVIGLAVPIVDAGEVIGVFKINFKLKIIIDIVAAHSLEQGYKILLARSDGSVIIGSDQDYPKELSSAEQQMIRSGTNGVWKSQANGAKTLAASYPMKHTFSTRQAQNALLGIAGESTSVKTWFVLYEVNEEVALAALQEMRGTAITMAMGAILLAILMGYWLSQAIFRPLAVLKRGTDVIGTGNLDHHIHLKEKNEFGMLADSFNAMSTKIKETLASRDELNQEIAERKIAERELNRFKTTLDLTLDCVFMFYPESLKFFYVNRGGIQQVGYTLEELLEMKPWEIKPEFDEQSFRKMCLSLVEQPEFPVTFESVHKTKQGRLIPVEVFLQYVVPDEEEPRFVAIVRDITERKKQQEEQAAHFQRVSAYQETIVNIAVNPAVVLADEAVIYPLITESAAKVMELERVSIWLFSEAPQAGLCCIDLYEQSKGQHCQERFIAESDYPDYFKILHEGQVIDAECADRDPRTREFSEGYLQPLNIKSMLDTPIRLEGKVVGVVCCEAVQECYAWLPEDITFAHEVAGQVAQVFANAQRRKAEEALNITRVMLQDVINSMPSVLITIDGERRITQWNQEASKMSGLQSEKAVGQKLEEALPISESLLHRILTLLEDHGSHLLLRQECRHLGKLQFIDVAIYPLTNTESDGTVIRLDYVTERVRIENMMSQTEKMMSIGGLAAGMAHELNNPLGGILQGLQNIQRRLSPELAKNIDTAEALGLDLQKVHQYLDERQVTRFMENIRHSSAQAAGIVANLVKFIRHPDAGMMAEDLVNLIDRTIELAWLDYDMKKKYAFRELKVVREYDSELMSVPCIASEIQQVILNGLRNAAQALALQKGRSEAGQITIRTKKQDAMAVIEIEDNGPGIDENILNRVFEPFYTTRDPGEGTGLGLSVSYYIVHDQHKGRLSMDSTPGKGSKLIIALPLKA